MRATPARIDNIPPERLGYSPAQFAAGFKKHPSWAYRLIYAGKVNVIADCKARMLIPRSEVEKFLGSARPYDPQPKPRKRKETNPTEAGGGQ
jgi:hypothetical protein